MKRSTYSHVASEKGTTTPLDWKNQPQAWNAWRPFCRSDGKTGFMLLNDMTILFRACAWPELYVMDLVNALRLHVHYERLVAEVINDDGTHSKPKWMGSRGTC